MMGTRLSQVLATSNDATIAIIKYCVPIPLHGSNFIFLGRAHNKALLAQWYRYL